MSELDVEPSRLATVGDADRGSLAFALRAARKHGPTSSELGAVRASLPLTPVVAPVGFGLKLGAVLGVVGIAALSTGALVRARPLPFASASASGVAATAPSASVREAPDAPIESPPSVADAPPVEALPASDASADVAPSASSPALRPPLPVSSSVAAEGPNEAALLLAAKGALATDPARALALTEEHKRRFPNGKLAEERDVIAIAALEKLGRSGAAKAESDRFKEQHPGSIHQPKPK